jgi:hypothetical protein
MDHGKVVEIGAVSPETKLRGLTQRVERGSVVSGLVIANAEYFPEMHIVRQCFDRLPGYQDGTRRDAKSRPGRGDQEVGEVVV